MLDLTQTLQNAKILSNLCHKIVMYSDIGMKTKKYFIIVCYNINFRINFL